MEFTIRDDVDLTQWGSFTANSEDPINTYYHDSRAQFVVLSSELSGADGDVVSLSLYINELPGLPSLEDFRIRIKHTSATATTEWEGDWTECFGPTSVARGDLTTGEWKKFVFGTVFEWNGTDNLLIDISRDDTGYQSGGGMMRRQIVETDRMFCGRCDNCTLYAETSGTEGGSTRNFIPAIQLEFDDGNTYVDAGRFDLKAGIYGAPWLALFEADTGAFSASGSMTGTPWLAIVDVGRFTTIAELHADPLREYMPSEMGFWTPAKIPTGLWLDAADSDTITIVDGAVSQWADKSGNDRHAEQPSEDERPTVTTLNGLHILDFRGLKFLRHPRYAEGYLFFVSDVVPASSGSRYVWTTRDTDSGNLALAVGISSHNSSVLCGTDFDTAAGRKYAPVVPSLSETAGAFNVFSTEKDLVRINGTDFDVLGGTNSPASTATYSFIGAQVLFHNSLWNAQSHMQASLAEFIFVPDLDAEEISKIEGYLAHKWKLEASLPIDHQYKNNPPYEDILTDAGTFTASSNFHGTPWLASVDSGSLAAQVELSGTPWLASVDVGKFGITADVLTGDPLAGYPVDAGKFTAAGQLAETQFLYVVEDCLLRLSGAISCDITPVWTGVPTGVFTIEGELSAPVIFTWDRQYSSLPMLTGGMSAKITGVSIHADMPSITGSLFTGAVIAEDMPMLTGEMTAQAERSGSVEAIMPMLTGQMFSGTSLVGTMPSLEGAMSAQAERTASVSAAMPSLTGWLDGWTEIVGDIAADMPMLTGTVSGYREGSASIAAHMPRLSGSMGVLIEETSSITGTLPMLSGSLTAGRTIPHDLTATMPVLTGFLVASRPMSWGVMRYSKGAYR